VKQQGGGGGGVTSLTQALALTQVYRNVKKLTLKILKKTLLIIISSFFDSLSG
jgi:hypothetical protein